MEDPIEPEETDGGWSSVSEGPASDEEVDAWRKALEEDEASTTPVQAGTGRVDAGDDIVGEADESAADAEPAAPVGTNVVPFQPDTAAGEEATLDAAPAGFAEPAERPRRVVRPKKPVKKSGGLSSSVVSVVLVSVAVSIVAATFVGAFVARETAVRLVPDLAGLYALAGLEVNLRGIDIVEVKTRREIDGATPVLVVEGILENVSATTRPVARIRFGLMSSTGREVYAWTMEAAKPTLDPGEMMPFRSRLPAPPDAANAVEVRFADRPSG